MTQFLLALAGACIVVAIAVAVFVGMQLLRLQHQLEAAEDEIEKLREELSRAAANAQAEASRGGEARTASGTPYTRSASGRLVRKKVKKDLS